MNPRASRQPSAARSSTRYGPEQLDPAAVVSEPIDLGALDRELVATTDDETGGIPVVERFA